MRYFLVFTPDRGSREDCNVYYSSLVIANDEKEAQVKFIMDSLEGHKKYLKKNKYPPLDEAGEKKFVDRIVFAAYEGDDSDDISHELYEVNPIQ